MVSAVHSYTEYASSSPKQHGGILTSAFRARIHLSSRADAIILSMDPNVPIWYLARVTDSIRWGGSSVSGRPCSRHVPELIRGTSDIMELLKARIRRAAVSVFRTTPVLR
jgi:hypothetical protein